MAKNAPRQKRGNNDWTVTVYMAADNSLAEESVWALTEILETESQLGGSVRIEVLFDSNAVGMPTQIYSIPTTNSQGITRADRVTRIGRLRTLGEDFSIPIGSPASPKNAKQLSSRPNSRGGQLDNASDRRLLKAFLIDTLKKHRNTHQLLVLSGHGSGAIGDFLSGKRAQQAISITGLGDTLEEVRNDVFGENNEYKFDIIGMDSCLMSMAEVAYELRNRANILIGSEGFEPETGWPYKEIIPEVNGAVDPTNLAREIVNKYIRYYADYAMAGTSVDLSACDLGRSEALVTSLKELSEILLREFSASDQEVIDAVLLAHWRAQSYKNEQYVDLWDFCDLLDKGCEVGAVKQACQNVRQVIDGTGSNGRPFVISSKYYGAAFQHSHGVSLYFPWKESPALAEYQKHSFAEDTKWGDFLKTYVKETQRKMRGESKHLRYGEPVSAEVERVDIAPAERPLVIPVQEDAPVGTRSPPDTGKGTLSGRGIMKNPPTSFLIDKENGEAVTEGEHLSLAAANKA